MQTPGGANLWRNRDFLLLWGGQAVSRLGSRVSDLALPLLVLALTRSPAQAGFVAAAQSLPYLLLGLPAGALADRWDRKRAMVLCDLARSPCSRWASTCSTVRSCWPSSSWPAPTCTPTRARSA